MLNLNENFTSKDLMEMLNLNVNVSAKCKFKC